VIRTVDFVPCSRAESLSQRGDLAIVSITEPEIGQAALDLPEARILRLAFHDVDPSDDLESRWLIFDDRHAGVRNGIAGGRSIGVSG
jgi:hypothetical protein